MSQFSRLACPLLLVVAGLSAASHGCSGLADDSEDADGGAPGGDGGGGGDGGQLATVQFIEPVSGSVFITDHLASTGWLAVTVPLSIEASGDFASIAIQTSTGTPLGELVSGGSLAAELTELGDLTLIARALDAAGEPVAEATVAISIAEPILPSCHAWLDLYGVEFTAGPASPGIADPVTVTTPINGMPYRYIESSSPRQTFYMDCSLAHSLAKAAPVFLERDIVEVADLGVYNYRCIGSGTPPDCPSGLSQHAFATAIDIAGVLDSNQVFYSVNDDWVVDPDTEATCTAQTANPKDALLHELICSLKGNRLWNIVLTPNYNSSHRNHIHVDLTPGADFIRSLALLVDVGPDGH